jgi:hypothetical protein
VKDSIKAGHTAERVLERQERISGAGVEGYSTGSDKLNPGQFARLEKSVQAQLGDEPLYGNDKITLTVTGSTSRLGDADKNADLAQSRADKTAQMFRDSGFTGRIETATHLSQSKDSSSDDPMERFVLGEAKVDGGDKPVDDPSVDEKPVDAKPADDKPVSSDDFSKAVNDAASIPIDALQIPWERIGEMAAEAARDGATSHPVAKALFAMEGPLAVLGEALTETAWNLGRDLANEHAEIILKEGAIKDAVMANVGAGFADGVAQQLGLTERSRAANKNSLYLASVKVGAASVAGWSKEARKNIDNAVRDPHQREVFLKELRTVYETRLNHEH